MNTLNSETANSAWKRLFLAGGIAPLVTIAFYLTELSVIIFGPKPFPATTEEWFSLFQYSKVLALFYLNAPDILSIAFLGLMFLALYRALVHVNKSGLTAGIFFAFLGIGVFVTTRSAILGVLPLSDQYAAAATETERSLLTAAARALVSLGNPTPQTTGFFFIAIAVLIISIVMLKTKIFNKVTAIAGIAAGILTVADDAILVILPSVAGALMGIAGGFWMLWWILISIKLIQLGRHGIIPDTERSKL